MRLFFCVELEEGVKEALAPVAQRLRRALGEGTWVSRENYHLTVRFLGEVPEARVPELLAVGEKAARGNPRFSLNLAVVGGFPNPSRARVLWVGPEKEVPAFRKLWQDVEEAVRVLGFPPERDEPLPHVTLARFKKPQDLRAFVPGPPLAIEVHGTSLTLMRSELRPEGAKYQPVSRWPLGG